MSEASLNSDSTLGSLPRSVIRAAAIDETRSLEKLFADDPTLPGVLIFDATGLSGAVSRSRFLEMIGRPFGREVFLGRPLSDLIRSLKSKPLILDSSELIHNAARIALDRDAAHRYEPIVVKTATPASESPLADWSLIDVAFLLQAQSQILTAQIEAHRLAVQQVREAQEKLLAASRQAGMAEVATSVLHNVGNVLNSLTVSTNLITERLKLSKVPNLGKAASLIQDHKDSLPDFFTADERGKALPGYLLKLSDFLAQEQKGLTEEVDGLVKSVEHIREIVSAQQSFAKASAVKQLVSLAEILDEALRINAVSFERHRIDVKRLFDPVPPLTADKHQLMQILINLVSNAKKAVRDSGREDRRVILRISNFEADGQTFARIHITDNGVGIPPENLTRIFHHGFTTRSDGHGFGLHNAANIVKQMGGSLTAESPGPGQGATFTLELPYQVSQAVHT